MEQSEQPEPGVVAGDFTAHAERVVGNAVEPLAVSAEPADVCQSGGGVARVHLARPGVEQIELLLYVSMRPTPPRAGHRSVATCSAATNPSIPLVGA